MKIKTLFIALLMFLLSACNGDSNKNGSSANELVRETIDIKVVPTQIKAMVSEPTQIEVITANNENVELHLTSVKSTNQSSMCQVTEIDGLTFTTRTDTTGECQYEYAVEPVDSVTYEGQAFSIARVSVSETSEDYTLPNLSATTNVESPVTIDLSVELESDLDTSIYAVSEEVTLLGSGSVEVDSLNNTITYTPTDIGVTRIMYSMTDGTATKLGNIDVAVSDTGNTPPVANDYIREGKLAKDMSIEIDLTEYVSDAEDYVILDSVRAYNAETEITSAAEHTFTFQSSQAGPHEVAYTVTDGRGGYAVGQVYIEVEPDFDLIQDWEDVTVFDQIINGSATFAGPMSKAMADYVNESYMSVNVEDGSQGPKYAQVVQMNWAQAKSYCEHRGGRLPLTRELEQLAVESPFQNHNWPTSSPYWSVDKTSSNEAALVSLSDGSYSISNTSIGTGYSTCVYLDGNVQGFTVSDVTSDDRGDGRSTTRFISSTLLDPDGYPAPYQDVLFWGAKGVGSFGIKNQDTESLVETDADGIATAIYDFTSGYEDNVMARYNGSADFTSVVLEMGSHDPTEPNDWNVSKILGANELETYEPIISGEGTMISLGEHDQYITSISRNNFMGSSFDIVFTVDRTKATKANAGAVNVVLQQVSSIAPDVNSWCDERIYGSCNWGADNSVGTAGVPAGDDRYLKIAFGYYYNNISVNTSDGKIGEGDQPNHSERIVHYRIVNDEGRIRVYYTLDENRENWTLSVDLILGSTPIKPDRFYYLGFSGGASSIDADGVIAYITHLSIEDR
ncbi:exported hypothetical protein [Vibrio coralliirubri]|uniref:Ig-like domain-containing protein n=1 Tax=Vibrio coralliirubri TaxID=1516159 RepID=UPI000637CFD2|nr:hypothetical protein [Vibrio coralliirubri]CDT68228.1 exported hypothetical protein [Vibrio coralliirubri]